MPVTWPSRTIGGPATISSRMWRAVPRANRRSCGSRSAPQTIVVDRVPVEQQEVGRLARRQRAAVVAVGDRSAAVAQHHAQHRGAARRRCGSPCRRCSRCASRISRSASSSSSNVEPSRPSATRQPRRTISSSGAMPDRRLRFELVLTEIVAPRAAISSSSSGRAQVQCASVSRGLSRPMLVEIADDALRIVRVRPGALVAGFEQMHVDAPAGARRCLRNRFQQVGACTIARACGPYWTSNVSLPAASATASTSAICCGDRQRRPQKRLADFFARVPRRQRGEDRLGRAVHQRIAVAHRDRKADPHADVARRARHLGRFGRQIGQALHAGVVHHHHAGTAERAARERHRGREIRIDRRARAPYSAARSPAACRTPPIELERTARAWSCAFDRTGSASTGSIRAPVAAGSTAAMCSPSIRMVCAGATVTSAAASRCAQVSSRIWHTRAAAVPLAPRSGERVPERSEGGRGAAFRRFRPLPARASRSPPSPARGEGKSRRRWMPYAIASEGKGGG